MIIVQNFYLGTYRKLRILLTPKEHQVFTNAWRKLVPYGTDYNTLTKDKIWQLAQNIYEDFPEFLKPAQETIFGKNR